MKVKLELFLGLFWTLRKAKTQQAERTSTKMTNKWERYKAIVINSSVLHICVLRKQNTGKYII
ncbi:hypothetical protein C0J52_28171 [Blattella germanica]|nr:hypothetical protein C0J52_28171 [Blattella germanica]